jgi:phenylacetate-coenzyme A ligase PaaK-like adenylate-forming protein
MNNQGSFEKRSADSCWITLQKVPFYRNSWAKYDPGDPADAAARFAAMPVLTKADMRAGFPNGLIPDGDVEKGCGTMPLNIHLLPGPPETKS